MSKLLTLEEFESAQRKHNFITWIALKHHRTHKKQYLSWGRYQYQIAIYNDPSDLIIIMKSTQNGITEYLIVRAIGKAILGLRVFYALPNFDLVKRVVNERYKKSLKYTPYYSSLAKMIKDEEGANQSQSVKSQDIGDGNITFANSGSPAAFTEYPADEVIVDEYDRCNQENIIMAEERLDNSDYGTQVRVSNPTFKKVGIDREMEGSDRKEWASFCRKGHRVFIDWFKHIVEEIAEGQYVIRDAEWNWNCGRDIYPICDKCGAPVDRYGKGQWIATAPWRGKSGYRLSKFFSGTATIVKILSRFTNALNNETLMTRVYNADFGYAYTPKGSSITRDMLYDNISNYTPGMYNLTNDEPGAIIAGVDVGNYYHVVIKKLLPSGQLKTIYIGMVQETVTLMGILRKYRVNAGVIDAGPEGRESKKVCKLPGMFRCFFGNVKADTFNPITKTLVVNRTEALDSVKEAIVTGAIRYPQAVLNSEVFVNQMTSSRRVHNPKKHINGIFGVFEWVEDGPDHYFLATAYCLMARQLLVLAERR